MTNVHSVCFLGVGVALEPSCDCMDGSDPTTQQSTFNGLILCSVCMFIIYFFDSY